jgi:UDP-N-acetylglucosamine 2-epimerase (non-hydrolysing)
MRVMTVYGTRPEAIKMAPLIEALHRSAVLEPVVVVTGQHRRMLDQVNDLFGIQPEFDLDILVPGQTLPDITSRALTGVTEVVQRLRPNAVVVQGDTTTAFAAALAAFYEQVPVVHLEAGLRTGNLASPFPEELNRRLTASVASLHLAPTATARANLLAEGFPTGSIAVTGNTVIDALLSTVARHVAFSDPRLDSVVSTGRRIVVVTTHRRESWGPPMVRAMGAVAELARLEPDVTVVLPMHRNPVVRNAVLAGLAELTNVILVEPLSYGEFARLLAVCTLVISDSGGIQEEAPSLGKPVLVLRDTTERPEALTAGTVRLVGTDHDAILTAATTLLRDPDAYERMARAVNPYGDGRAAPRALAAIEELLGVGMRLPDFAGDTAASGPGDVPGISAGRLADVAGRRRRPHGHSGSR